MCWNKGDSGSPFMRKIMDYEKKYKEALERVRRLHDRMLVLSSTDALVASAELEFIFPELAESESEDERIRRKMIEHFKAKTKETWCNMPVKDIIAYLEKQKETLHISEMYKENVDSFTDIKDRNIRGCIGMALADVSESRFKIYGVTLKECLAYLEKQKEQKPILPEDKVKHPLYVEGFEAGKEIGRQCEKVFGKQKEQKPVEPSDDELQRHQDELYNFKVFAAKQAKEHHISFVHDFEWNNFCAELLSYFNEQKPTSISCGHENDAEWGQEDKEKIVTISEIIEHCTTIPYSGGTLTLNKEYKKELLCFIRTLRPSWKPSEEQMEALKRAGTNEYLSAKQFDILVSLYEQLKKL